MTSAQAFVFAAFLCLIGSGFALITVASKNTNTLNGFVLASRSLKQPSIVASLAATNAALANIVFLYAYWGYTFGAAAIVWGAAFWAAGLLVFLAALRWGRLAKLLGSTQPALGFNEILGREFGGRRIVTAVTAIASGLTFLFLLSLEVGVGSNAAIRLVSDSPMASYGFSPEALLIGGALVVLISAYGYIGGFPMVVRTDLWQLGLVLLGLVAAVALSDSLVSGAGKELLGVIRASFSHSDYFRWDWSMAPFVIGSIFSWGLWFICTMDSWQRALAAAPEENRRIRPSAIIAGIALLIVVSTVSAIIGITVKELWTGASPPAYPVIEFIGLVKATIAGSEINGILVAVVMAGFLAAMASTVDTYMVIVGQSFGGDLLRKKPLSEYVGSQDEHKVLFWVRAIGIAAPIIGLGGFALLHVVGRQDNFTLYMLAGSLPMSLIPISAWCIWGRRWSNRSPGGVWTSIGILIAITISLFVNHNLASDALATYRPSSFGLLYFVPLLTASVAAVFLGIDVATAKTRFAEEE